MNEIRMKVGEENSLVSKYLKTLIDLVLSERKLRSQKNRVRKPFICWPITFFDSGIVLCRLM